MSRISLNNRWIWISAASTLAITAAVYFRAAPAPAGPTPPPLATTPPPALTSRRAPASLPPPAPTIKPGDTFYADYFHKNLLNNPRVEKIYRYVMNRLPAGKDSETIAVYISEGIVRNSSPDFVHFMNSLTSEIRLNSNTLYPLLLAQDEALKSNPFVYQMTLNMAFQMDIPPEQRAKVMGSAMGIHFARDAVTGVTMMSANITNAMILMKNSGVTLAQAAPYLAQGHTLNSDDPDSEREFSARADAYYPGWR